MNAAGDRAVVDAAVAALKDLGLDVGARSGGGKKPEEEFIVTLRHGGKTIRYGAEVKRRLTPSLVRPVALVFTRPGEKRLLLTDYVTPPVGDALRRHGVQFADTAGNAYLEDGDVFVVITGRTAKSAIPRTKTYRVFHRSGLQILFALLSSPDCVSASHRAIANAANVSLGSVPAVLEGLRKTGFVAEVKGRRRLIDRDRLIDQWVEGYVRRILPSLDMGRFHASTADWWSRVEAASYGVHWGGETAAALLQGHLRPEHVIMYADAVPSRLLSAERLKADLVGEVFLRRRFWGAVPSPRTDIVPALLVYADLIAAGDARTLAEAKRIRETYLG